MNSCVKRASVRHSCNHNFVNVVAAAVVVVVARVRIFCLQADVRQSRPKKSDATSLGTRSCGDPQRGAGTTDLPLQTPRSRLPCFLPTPVTLSPPLPLSLSLPLPLSMP